MSGKNDKIRTVQTQYKGRADWIYKFDYNGQYRNKTHELIENGDTSFAIRALSGKFCNKVKPDFVRSFKTTTMDTRLIVYESVIQTVVTNWLFAQNLNTLLNGVDVNAIIVPVFGQC